MLYNKSEQQHVCASFIQSNLEQRIRKTEEEVDKIIKMLLDATSYTKEVCSILYCICLLIILFSNGKLKLLSS